MIEIFHIPLPLWILASGLYPAIKAKQTWEFAEYAGYACRRYFFHSAWWQILLLAILLSDAFYMAWFVYSLSGPMPFLQMSEDTLTTIGKVLTLVLMVGSLGPLDRAHRRVETVEWEERTRNFRHRLR